MRYDSYTHPLVWLLLAALVLGLLSLALLWLRRRPVRVGDWVTVYARHLALSGGQLVLEQSTFTGEVIQVGRDGCVLDDGDGERLIPFFLSTISRVNGEVIVAVTYPSPSDNATLYRYANADYGGGSRP